VFDKYDEVCAVSDVILLTLVDIEDSFVVVLDAKDEDVAVSVAVLVAISAAMDELKDVDDPDISVAICAELDKTPLVERRDPVIPFETLTLPVKVCVSSGVFPNRDDPESNRIEELTNSDLNSCAVTVPSITRSPDNCPDPEIDKWLLL
jgi:hypothetical protein